MGIVLRQEPHLVDMNVATVAVIELDEDVVGLEVGANDGAGVEVAHLVAPVDSHSPASLELGHSSGSNFQDLRKKGFMMFSKLKRFITCQRVLFSVRTSSWKEDNFETNTCDRTGDDAIIAI